MRNLALAARMRLRGRECYVTRDLLGSDSHTSPKRVGVTLGSTKKQTKKRRIMKVENTELSTVHIGRKNKT